MTSHRPHVALGPILKGGSGRGSKASLPMAGLSARLSPACVHFLPALALCKGRQLKSWIYLFKIFNLFFWLHRILAAVSLVAACELSVGTCEFLVAMCGIPFPDQGSNLSPSVGSMEY